MLDVYLHQRELIVKGTYTMDINLSKLHEIVQNRGAWDAAVHGVAKSQTLLTD